MCWFMHLSNCLAPKRIVNPYSHEVQLVPCGKCSACLNARALRWQERLEQERYCWQYCLFFTLTYSDENLPVMQYNSHGYYSDTSSVHFDVVGRKEFPFVDCNELRDKYAHDAVEYRKIDSFINSHPVLPYVSSYDAQKFVKRVRINLFRKVDKNEKIRYFICSEYGPKHLRPHLHGLFFFNSTQFAAQIHEVISQAWQFGFINTSFVSSCNADYVTKYLNSVAHSCKIYEHRMLRPFILCSKMPPLGTLSHSSEEIRKIFFEASPEFVIQNHRTNAFDNVPLWNVYKDRLYPKLSAFDRLTHYDRNTLYGTFERVERKFFRQEMSYDLFKNYVLSDAALPAEKSYISYFKSFQENIDNSIIRWYHVSSRVTYQAAVFGLSVIQYVKYIEKFYNNIESYKLKNQFQFEQEFADEFGCTSLVGLDRLWLQSLLDFELFDLTYEEILTLQSYGIDLEKMYSSDLEERFAYQSALLPDNTFDMLAFKIDSEVLLDKNLKKKQKNEYLQNCDALDDFYKMNPDFLPDGRYRQQYADF